MAKNFIVYDLAPQMRIYHEMGEVWKPFIMFISRPNYRSNVVNSDKFGLRFNTLNNKDKLKTKKNNSIFNQKIISKKKTGVLIGGSAAFGFGASSDSKTISSILSEKTNTHFYNLGNSAFSGFQEIILFNSLSNYLVNINKIVIFSGLNDIFFSEFSKKYDQILGPFFFYNEFIEGMEKKTLRSSRKMAKFIFDPFIKEKINWNLITKKELFNRLINKNLKNNKSIFNNEQNMKNILKRNLICWSNIQKAMGVKLLYILQPMPSWFNKELSYEEEIIFNQLDSSSFVNFRNLKQLNYKKFLLYKNYIKEVCKKLKIQLVDSNEYLKGKPFSKEWLFVDRAHMTDLGYKKISDMILSKL